MSNKGINGGEKREDLDYDRARVVKEFDETRSGVKGLLDSGLIKIPRIFIHPPENLQKTTGSSCGMQQIKVPVIDLAGFRGEIVNKIHEAARTWGFFQMVNHGVPGSVMGEVMGCVRGFHEQPREMKMVWYSRDSNQRVKFYSNGNLHVLKAANWRDSISFNYDDGELDPNALPIICRKAIGEYMESIFKLKEMLSELISEALGLNSNFLRSIDCMKTATLVCHYYPHCPEPDLTLGATKHSDPSFLTILLQDNIGGLQVLHQNQWIDVRPIQGALIANIGDFMQLITNDKLNSVEHRVLVQKGGPRISIACFFYPSTANVSKPYGPIDEFISDDNPPIYRKTNLQEYQAYYRSKGLDGSSTLPYFKI